MIRRLALTAGFAVLGAVAFAPDASAQTTETVPFSGEFGSVCTFGDVQPGILAQEQSDRAWVQASSDLPGISEVGQSGQTTVNCTGEASLSVSTPVETSVPPTFSGQPTYAVVYDGTNTTAAGTPINPGWDRPTAALTIPANTDVNLGVSMTAGEENIGPGVPSGTYEYEVTLTATPN